MKNLKFFLFFGLIVGVLAGNHLLNRRDRDTTFKKVKEFRGRGWCDSLNWDGISQYNIKKHLICNISAVQQICRDRATEFYYATTYENVSRAVRGAAAEFPQIEAIVRAMDSVTYEAIDCLHQSFIEVQQGMQSGEIEPGNFPEEWRSRCSEYDDELNPMIDAMNASVNASNEIFLYTYPNLTDHVKFVIGNFFTHSGFFWNGSTWESYHSSSLYGNILFHLSHLSDENRAVFLEVIPWSSDTIALDGDLHEEFVRYADQVLRFRRAMSDNVSDPFTLDDYEELLELNLIFEQYYRENAINFWIDVLHRLLENSVVDDKSDPVITKVSYLIADVVTNATNNTGGDGGSSGDPAPPPNEYLDKICDYLLNSDGDLPTIPGMEHGCAIFRYINEVTKDIRENYGGHHNWFWRRSSHWKGKGKGIFDKFKDFKNFKNDKKSKNNNKSKNYNRRG